VPERLPWRISVARRGIHVEIPECRNIKHTYHLQGHQFDEWFPWGLPDNLVLGTSKVWIDYANRGRQHLPPKGLPTKPNRQQDQE
jgi:hypothetical protein